MRELTARVRLLEDHCEIAQLVAQYGPAIDSGSMTAATKLWAPGGVYDVLDVDRWEGRAAITGMLEGPGHQGVLTAGCGHIVTPPHIVIDGDEATGRSHQLLCVWDKEEQRFWVMRVSATQWHFKRTARGWKIATRTNHNLNGTGIPRSLFAYELED